MKGFPCEAICIKEDSHDADTGEMQTPVLKSGNYYTLLGPFSQDPEYFWVEGIAKKVFHHSLFGIPSGLDETVPESRDSEHEHEAIIYQR